MDPSGECRLEGIVEMINWAYRVNVRPIVGQPLGVYWPAKAEEQSARWGLKRQASRGVKSGKGAKELCSTADMAVLCISNEAVF